MTTGIIPETSEETVAEKVAERANRGWDLYRSKRQLITKTGENTYTVPSCTESRRDQRGYTVQYGADVESCTCTDYSVHRGQIACEHLTAVALFYATRRRVLSRCAVCGASSREKTLIGIRGDRDRHGPRYCLPHHPESIGQEVNRIAKAKEREAQIQEGLRWPPRRTS